MPRWAITPLVIGVVLCMPLWIPAVLILDAVRKHRLRRAANAFACVACGRILGPGALARADKAWAEHVRELMRRNPGVRFRLVRTVHAICPDCGTHYTFREHERTFVREEPLSSDSVTWTSGTASTI
jgi:predicted RNA-binding Zn-ribbon protein involved in translation (DUF1610 family)